MSHLSSTPLESAVDDGEKGMSLSTPIEQNSMEPVSVKAHGKAILVGEHAVIYGARAIAFPVKSVGMEIQLMRSSFHNRSSADQTVLIKASLGGRPVSDHLKNVIFEAFEILDVSPFSLEIEGSSTGLIGAGMGSSATLCVVILRAIAEAVGRHLTPREISNFANRLERHFHGNPSGLDTAVVAFESPICFRIGSPPELIHPTPLPDSDDMSWPFVLLDSSTRSSTIAMVKGVAPYFLSPQDGSRRTDRFDRLALVAQKGLVEGDGDAVAFAMKESGSLLREAGASSKVLDEIITLCDSLGCLAAKPTGAGGGGCVLALLDPKAKINQLGSLRQKLGPNRVIPVNGSLLGSPSAPQMAPPYGVQPGSRPLF